MNNQKRNINPHKAALIALCIWGYEYAQQGGGSMDFWDKLSESRKRQCRDVVKKLSAAPEEPKV